VINQRTELALTDNLFIAWLILQTVTPDEWIGDGQVRGAVDRSFVRASRPRHGFSSERDGCTDGRTDGQTDFTLAIALH